MENPPRQPMLVIREMVLENFKSYAGAQRVGPFHKVSQVLIFHSKLWRQSTGTKLFSGCSQPTNQLPFLQSFSSVVGPNGSGKSNVIDAMLFVFGKRAKQLRLNKVSELIHNSTYHQDLEMAKVSVYFQEIIDVVSAQRTYVHIPLFISLTTVFIFPSPCVVVG